MLYFIKDFMLFIQFNWNLSHTDKVWDLYDLLLKKSKDIFNFTKKKIYFIFIKIILRKMFHGSSTNFDIENKYF